jgi:hypothetical protein
MKKRTIYKLDIPQKIFPSTIIGISSHENDYRLSWCLNQQLGLNFVQSGNFTAKTGEKFTCFSHQDEEQAFCVISNRCDNGFLMKKYKNFDFLLKFERELDEAELAGWLQNLKKIPLISAVLPIPLDQTCL